jgi:transposase
METPPAFPHEVWKRTPPEAQAYIQALEACLETLVSKVHALQEQVRTLQEQLHQTSQNSSRPPSSDPPQHGRPRRPRSHRRRGGQPGHPGHTRTLIPVEEVDEVVVIKPEQCAHCQASLSGEDPQPWRHQVIELPPIKPVVTEYQWQQLRCSACGEVTRAMARRGPQRDLRSSGAGDGGAVYGVVSLVQAYDAADDGRCV